MLVVELVKAPFCKNVISRVQVTPSTQSYDETERCTKLFVWEYCVRTILAVAVYSVMSELFICLGEVQEMISSILSRGTIYGTLADVVYALD